MSLKSVLLTFLFACSGSSATTPPSKTPTGGAPVATQAGSAAAETSSATSCVKDDDCHCRVFDGAKFKDGRAASKCCTQDDGCPDAMGAKVAAHHCMTCVYD